MAIKQDKHVIEYIRCKNNFLYFLFNYIKIPEIGGARLYTPDMLNPKFKQVITTVLKIGHGNLMATRQLGKALAIDTPIPQANGEWTTMGDLQPGHKILGTDGNEISVLKCTDVMYDHQCFKIEFDYALPIIADAEHLWKISYSPYKYEDKILTTVELKELLEKPSSKSGRPYIISAEAVANDEVDLPIPPYTLGLWLGDGASKQANIATSTFDHDEIMELICKDGFDITHYKEKDHTPSGYFGVYGLITLLKKYNLFGNKHIPRIYFSGSIDQRLELLRGLMDSDGTVDEKSGSCQFYQKSKLLIDNVRELLFSLGIKNRITTKLIKNQIYYTIKFCCREYKVFNLTRKLDRLTGCYDHPKNYRHYVTKITQVDSVPVKCIEVDSEDKMFLCGSFIPTHNSTISAALLEYCMNFYPGNRGIILNMQKTAALENLSKVKFMHEHLPEFLKSPLRFKGDRKTYLEYNNGSLLRVFYPSSTTPAEQLARSLSSPILYIDECAFINHIAEAYGSAQPTLSKAREQAKKSGYPSFILLSSTPNGCVGTGQFYYEMYQHGIDADLIFDEDNNLIPGYETVVNDNSNNGFINVKYHWSEDPTKDEEWYLKQKREMNFDKRRINIYT